MSAALSEFFKDIGKLGGRITAERMTPAQKSERARKAAQARWSKPRKKRKGKK